MANMNSLGLVLRARLRTKAGQCHLSNGISRCPVRAYSTRTLSSVQIPRWGASAMWGASAGLVALLGYSFSSHADCLSNEIPSLTLYQYATCPYCCKTRAFLDYYQVPYTVVEVNPLFRKETKFSEYKKVPFVTGGGVQVNDSTLIVSSVRSAMVNNGLSISQALDFYPLVPYTDSKGKTQEDRANKYFIMFPDGGSDSLSLAQRREEREWREWVDNKLVHILPSNIYRTFSESITSFDYISSVGNFSRFERVATKYIGAVSMFLISKKLKKRYHLKEDVRESLYDACSEWLAAVGDRRFMGGDSPNLADLAVYGVLSSTEGMGPTFVDVMAHTKIETWYRDVQHCVDKGLGGNTDKED
ncbi:prostaglandin E synthase 2-like [Halichondria panicea]|uniref:prostaglandin E synthase 2-like n=1 Tax=Halichondria panicea TaxID=6063 RepID=UPI00312B7885